MALALLAVSSVSAGQEQAPPPGLVNGDMESVDAEGKLVGWRVSAALLEAGYEIGPEREDVHAGEVAARIDSRAVEPGSNSFGNLSQSFDAKPWQGKRIRYRAAVKVPEAESGGQAQLWLRVDRASKGSTPRMGFFDNMGDRPITSDAWQSYEIVGDVAADAQTVVFGVLAIGQCLVLVDEASLEEVASDVTPTASANPMDDRAPTQPFWTAWLWLPCLALVLFALGMLGKGRATRFALYFTAAYWALYTLTAMLGFVVPFWGQAWSVALETGPIDELVRAAARAWLGLEGTLVSAHQNGSGDTTFSYVQTFLTFVGASVVAVVGGLCDRGAGDALRRKDLLRSALCVYLGAFMVSYGLAKLGSLSNQFPETNTWRLAQPYGESSPMGLLWTFMGSSRPYTYLAGAAELLGGFLLLWRRTALLGALVSAGVMLNVMAMNFCYDVPVKLFSAHLVVAALVIALPEASRLAQLFLGVGAGTPAALASPLTGRVGAWLRRGVKAWLVFAIFLQPCYGLWKSERASAGVRPVVGEWKLESLALSGEPITPEDGELTTLTLNRWQMTADDDGWRFAASASTAAGANLTPTVRWTPEKLVLETNAGTESLLLPGEFSWRVEGPRLFLA
ncbi:MAG: hypothetical protein ABL998_14130, partial [Planctomycetota bacterium]